MTKTKPTKTASDPCDCCGAKVATTDRGYVVLADKRLICKTCYETTAYRVRK